MVILAVIITSRDNYYTCDVLDKDTAPFKKGTILAKSASKIILGLDIPSSIYES